MSKMNADTLHEFDPAFHVKLVADSPDKIRPQDVERLYEETERANWPKLSAYLERHRHDLGMTVAAVLLALTAEERDA